MCSLLSFDVVKSLSNISDRPSSLLVGERKVNSNDLSNLSGLYLPRTESKCLNLYLDAGKNYFPGRAGYELIVNGNEAQLHKVCIVTEKDIDEIPNDFDVFVGSGLIRIDYPDFRQTKGYKAYLKYKTIDRRSEKEERWYQALKKYIDGQTYSYNTYGDYLAFNRRYVLSLNIELNVLKMVTETGFSPVPSTFSKVEKGYMLELENKDYILIENNDNHFSFDADPKDYGKASGDSKIHLTRVVPNAIKTSNKEDFTNELKGVFNFKYWYVYVVLVLGALIIGLLSFLPIKYFM